MEVEAPEAVGKGSLVGGGKSYGSIPSDGENSCKVQLQPPRHLDWMGAIGAINASVIGIGVLAVPHSFTKLGWVLSAVMLVLCLAGNCFVAYLMREVQRLEPLALSMADAAYLAAGEREGARLFVQVILYSEKVAGLCPALALLATTLGSAFYKVHICHGWWCLIIMSVLVPAGQLKTIRETSWLNILNLKTIFAAAICTLVGLASSAPEVSERHLWPLMDSERPLEFFGAINVIVFAYAGNWLYFEVMAEMENPNDFMKSFAVAGPVQLGLYALVGGLGYAFWGANLPASMVDALRFGGLMRVTAFLLVVHILAGTVTGSVIVFRFLVSRVSVEDFSKDTAHSRLVRFILVATVWGLVLVVVLAVPSFGSLVSLLGALFEAPISFILPVITYAGVAHRHREREGSPPVWVWIVGTLVATIGAVITVLGTIEAIGGLGLAKTAPFSCVCEGIWDTCGCSSSRMAPQICHLASSG
mmetsp:Transcript_133776/g.286103  ORF Transcript_133776/g.286103 Transcript_133776/m.286103 type:complete len:474 (-) Transcript_133776:48-1469(-)